MPAQNLDRVKKIEGALVERLGKDNAALASEQLRTLKKKVRRAQRKRRRLETEAARRAAKAAKPTSDAEKSD